MLKVCFCPSTLKWIFAHLTKSSKSTFRKMIKTNSTSVKRLGNTKANRAAMKRFPKIRGGKRKQSAKQKAAQARLTRAAKKCKGKGKGFRPCMKRELKKRR